VASDSFRRNRRSATPSFNSDVAGREPLRRAPPSAHGRVARRGSPPWFRRGDRLAESSPLTAAELRGRVVLVDFWTYTCINWLRTLAFVRAWSVKYRDLGLVVIGVHTPEFPFE